MFLVDFYVMFLRCTSITFTCVRTWHWLVFLRTYERIAVVAWSLWLAAPPSILLPFANVIPSSELKQSIVCLPHSALCLPDFDCGTKKRLRAKQRPAAITKISLLAKSTLVRLIVYSGPPADLCTQDRAGHASSHPLNSEWANFTSPEYAHPGIILPSSVTVPIFRSLTNKTIGPKYFPGVVVFHPRSKYQTLLNASFSSYFNRHLFLQPCTLPQKQKWHGRLPYDDAITLTLLVPQSRFGGKQVEFQVIRPQNGTGVLKGLIR